MTLMKLAQTWKTGSKAKRQALVEEIPSAIENLAFNYKTRALSPTEPPMKCEPSVDSIQNYLNENVPRKIAVQAALNVYKEECSVTPKDIMYLEQNVSGTRLFETLRKKYPGLMPSRREVSHTKSISLEEFEAVLLPRRSSTGWYVNPERLVELLHFRYPFLPVEKSISIYGDGRVVGGRQSTYLALSLLNHELLLNGVSYHSSKEIFPVAIFYESDSRDNLEENLGSKNFISEYKSKHCTQSKFYLSGDEMFLEKMIDGSNILGPLSDCGWNIYSAWDKEHKSKVGSDGLRTSIEPQFDRELPESLVPQVDLQNIMMCTLHGQTRVVEKLLNLEVNRAISQANINAQTGNFVNKEDLIHNLEDNINIRGVRQGNFRILFDKQGKPEPVSLNKTHAYSILSPPPPGKENIMPHVLNNVVGTEDVELNLSLEILNHLGLPKTLSEFNLVKTIWDSFFGMIQIIEKDTRILKDGKPEGSVFPSDYTWGCSESDVKKYEIFAETFFQLDKLRYGAQCLTPYMIKFINYVPHFLRHSEIPLCRFQTEGGEHGNYDHNLFYYQHTTRHGGKHRNDPIKALLCSIFKRICYEVEPSTHDDLHHYVLRHRSATLIQKHVRGFLVRRRLRAAGYIEFATDPIQRARNFEILKEEIQPNNKCPSPLPFHNMSFILAGTVPKYGTKKYSQSDVEALIRKHGGKCRKQVPGIMKGRSTKKYVTLCSTQALKGKSVNSTIKKAVRLNYPIVDYRFVFDSADMAIRQDLKQYVHDTSRLQCYISRNQTLGKVHFKREKNLINIIKNRRKSSKVKAAIHSHKVPRNVVMYYVKCKLAECGDKYSFVQYNSFVSKMAKEWVKEPPHVQSKYIDSMHRLQDDKISSLRLRQSLANYNKVVNPVFKTFLGWNYHKQNDSWVSDIQSECFKYSPHCPSMD